MNEHDARTELKFVEQNLAALVDRKSALKAVIRQHDERKAIAEDQYRSLIKTLRRYAEVGVVTHTDYCNGQSNYMKLPVAGEAADMIEQMAVVLVEARKFAQWPAGLDKLKRVTALIDRVLS